MAWTPCLRGLLVAGALFVTGCAVPQSLEGWFEEAAVWHGAKFDFPGAAAILEGFDEPRPNDEFERGDRALYGMRLAGEDFLVLFEVAGVPGEPFSSVMHSMDLRSPSIGIAQRTEGAHVHIDEPRNRCLVATVFDGRGTAIRSDRMVVAPALFCAGLAAGCASVSEYEQERRRGRLGPAARRFLMALAACGEFLSVVRRSDSLRPLLEQAVAVSLWSVLRSFSIKVTVRRRILDAVPHGDGFRFPLTILINGDPALDCSVIVTEPLSPLNVGAGIVSIVGIRPGEREPTVTLRLLAARRGASR
ncbi:MAG: hypothetical protein NXI31_27230 [bacterium]|nr:hypothetical protein [bacterium]